MPMSISATQALYRPARRGEGIVARLRAEVRARLVYARTLRELRALSARELADLGIPRSMITRLAAEAAWGQR
jgi:uncharacterized protein YjiS (DUF1127 family)